MKAISLQQPWASMIARGEKTVETRRWSTSYRGELLIASTKKPKLLALPSGFALCVVDMIGCVPMRKEHEVGACCPMYHGAYAWILANIRPFRRPFAVRGSQGFYEVELPEEYR